MGALAFGIANIAADGTVLDTWYPEPELGEFPDSETTPVTKPPVNLTSLVGQDDARGVRQLAVRTTIADLSAPPIDAHDAYLRLHLISHRLVRPHGTNLDGVFGLLANVVWTNYGPVPSRRLRGRAGPSAGAWAGHRLRGRQVPPDGRLRGALRGTHRRRRPGPPRRAPGRGTTVMHEGFVNYNAGTLGIVDGGGPHLRGRGRRRRQRHRRRRLDHGHPVRWRQRGHLDR